LTGQPFYFTRFESLTTRQQQIVVRQIPTADLAAEVKRRFDGGSYEARWNGWNDRFVALAAEVEAEVRKQARLVLRQNSNLVEFVKADGRWFFTYGWAGPDNAAPNYLMKFVVVARLIARWDRALGLTSNPVRFTVDGPEIASWPRDEERVDGSRDAAGP
jgi:hypothetical protein